MLSLLCLLDCVAAGAEHKDSPGNTQPRASALLPLSTFLQQSNKGFFFPSPWDRNSLPGEGSRRQRDLTAGCLPPVSIPTKSLSWRSRPRLRGNQDRCESLVLLSSNSSHERCRPVSPVRRSVTLWTVAHQAPLSLELSRQESWHRLPFPSPGDLPNPGIGPGSPASQTDS